jgi:hypothetical protein
MSINNGIFLSTRPKKKASPMDWFFFLDSLTLHRIGLCVILSEQSEVSPRTALFLTQQH